MPKILLVEDNEMNRDMLSRRLIRRGYEVVLATNGQEGLDLVGGQGVALEEVAPLGDERGTGRDGFSL